MLIYNEPWYIDLYLIDTIYTVDDRKETTLYIVYTVAV